VAFTDFGIENLIALIKIYKDDPTLLQRGDGSKCNYSPCCGELTRGDGVPDANLNQRVCECTG
jgi:hypothetical protein